MAIYHSPLAVRSAVLVALILTVLLAVSAYVAGYFLLSDKVGAEYDLKLRETMVIRQFPQDWQCEMYRPLQELEEACTGRRVVIQRPWNWGNLTEGELRESRTLCSPLLKGQQQNMVTSRNAD